MCRFWLSQYTMTSLFCPFQFMHPCPLPIYHIISRHYSTINLGLSEAKWSEEKVAHSLCDPMDYTVHGILEWIALFLVIPFLSLSGTSICRYNPSISHEEKFQHWPASCYRLQSPCLSREETVGTQWIPTGVRSPSPGDLPNPGIKPRSPAL